MRPESYQLFAQLLESQLDEASTSMALIASKPGGRQVVQALHQSMKLAHDINYSPIDKISWSDLKDAWLGKWVIIQGTTGTGAIKAYRGSYEAVASSGGEVEKFKSERGGNILDFLKGKIGKLQKYYVGKNTSYVGDVQSKRADAKKGAGTAEVTNDTLIVKFRPLWIRATQAAMADVKGHIANMIKNDAFAKAQKKIERLSNLQNGIEALESGDQNEPGFIRSAVATATLMAASHYYPEQTGNITKSRYGSGGYSAQFHEGPQQLLKDIAAGDQKKLGTVLAFFKRALISG